MTKPSNKGEQSSKGGCEGTNNNAKWFSKGKRIVQWHLDESQVYKPKGKLKKHAEGEITAQNRNPQSSQKASIRPSSCLSSPSNECKIKPQSLTNSLHHRGKTFNQEQTIYCGCFVGEKPSTEESPMERLIKVINSMSAPAFASAVDDIRRVVRSTDGMLGSPPGNGFEAAVGEDLGDNGTKNVKRPKNSIHVGTLSSDGILANSLKRLYDQEPSEIKPKETSIVKRPRLEMSHTVQDELQKINQRLIRTADDMKEDDKDAAKMMFRRIPWLFHHII